MTPKEVYDILTKEMTAEEVLMNILKSNIPDYEKNIEKIHPILLIGMAAADLGWELSVPYTEDDDEVEGMIIGSEKYFESINGIHEIEDGDEGCCDGDCTGCGDETGTDIPFGVDIND